MINNQVMVLSPIEVQNFIEQTVKATVEKVVQDFQLQTSEPQKEILTIDEACEILNLAKPTIYTLTSKGELPFFKRGKKLYFKYSSLMQWIDDGHCKSNDELQKEAEVYLKKKRK